MKLRLLFNTILLYVIAQGLAIVATDQLKDLPVPYISMSGEPISLMHFLLLFFAATVFLLILFEFARGKILFRLFFVSVLFVGLTKLFELVFPLSLSLIVSSMFIAAVFLLPIIWTHDMIVILASAGIGPLFGMQFSWELAAILLVILSLYDFIAVFITHHMVTLEHEMLRHQSSFALIVPEFGHDFKAHLASVLPGSGFLILGGGDVVLPMFLSTSAFVFDPILGVWVMAGTVFGVFLNHMLLMSLRHPLPALPFITLGAFIGLLFGMIF